MHLREQRTSVWRPYALNASRKPRNVATTPRNHAAMIDELASYTHIDAGKAPGHRTQRGPREHVHERRLGRRGRDAYSRTLNYKVMRKHRILRLRLPFTNHNAKNIELITCYRVVRGRDPACKKLLSIRTSEFTS